jgi:hypothetical protein
MRELLMETKYWFRYFFFIFILLQTTISFGMKPEESDGDIETPPTAALRPAINSEEHSLLADSKLSNNGYDSTTNYFEKEPPVIFVTLRGSTDDKNPWQTFQSALCYRNPKYQQGAFTGDDTFKMTQELDTAFFQSMNNPLSKKQMVGGTIGMLLGCAPAQMDVPSDNVALVRTFNWTYAGDNTWIAGGLITAFTTPIYMTQLAQLGIQAASLFDPKSPMDKFRNKRSVAHNFCDWVLAPLYATVPTIVDVAYFTWLESGNWEYYGLIVGPGAFARFHRRVEIAQRPFDNMFYRKYSSKSTNAYKDVVYASIELCKKKTRIDQKFRTAVFNLLMDRYELEEDTLRLGGLCLTDSTGLVGTNLAFQLDMYDVSPIASRHSFLSNAADVIQGAALFANLSAVTYTLQNLVFGSTSNLWTTVSKSVAVADSVSQVLLERGVTIDFLTSYGGGLFSWPSNFPITRKVTEVINLANSALHSFPLIYLAQQGIAQDYAATTPYTQTLFLAPLALRELAYNDEYYNQYTNDLIWGAARFRLRNASAHQQQSYIERFIKAYKAEIVKMEHETFSNYFQVFFKPPEDPEGSSPL